MNQTGIDLWQLPLDGGSEAVNAALRVLCTDERAHFRQFGNSRLAWVFAIRRAYRRVILARYLEIEPLEVRVHDTLSGKPEFPDPLTNLHFSASHSNGRGILSVSKQFQIGADIEHLRPIDTNTLAARILSPSERWEFDSVEPDARNSCMFRVWTGKEALIKGIGVGLDLHDLPLIDLPMAPAPGGWNPAGFAGRMRRHGQWHVYSMAPLNGYYISIAAPSEAAVTVINTQGLVAEWGI
jgi:4'-phosphopantetheinyl transferase